MSLTLQTTWMEIQSALEDNAHPITKDWFLVPSLVPVLIILAAYLYFCKIAGPRYMKHRKPYDLKNIIIIYNLLQILASIYVVYEGIVCAWIINFNFVCEPVDVSDSPLSKRMAAGAWLYFINKLVDLLDTVFFVLRKKDKQITTLHLCHHIMMPIGTWVGVRFGPSGHGGLGGVINAAVHTVMYTYYLISGLGPEYKKYLWWKKNLTKVQMVQFFVVFVHNTMGFFIECSYPKALNMFGIVYSSIFLIMFSKFYILNYVKTDKKIN